MDAVGIFLTGWFFGLCLGVGIMAVRKTSKELDEVNSKIKEMETQERSVTYNFINYSDEMTDKEFEEFLFGKNGGKVHE